MTSLKKFIRLPIPKCRDPFVNTPLISVGKGADGIERFWISTSNEQTGCMGALVDDRGGYRMYRFSGSEFGTFYSAAVENANTLWLCHNLDRVVRLDLRSGKVESFETGAPPALVFSGMRFDPATGKLFAFAYPTAHGTRAFSFDTRSRIPVNVYSDLSSNYYMYNSFPNGDGSYTFVLRIPNVSFLRWDPATESVKTVKEFPISGGSSFNHFYFFHSLIQNGSGEWYLPDHGWYDSLKQEIDPSGPQPEKEARWFWSGSKHALGLESQDPDSSQLVRWTLATGRVEKVASIPFTALGVVRSESGRIVGVGNYGEYWVQDPESGSIEISKQLPNLSVQVVSSLVRVDRHHVIGAPFITQRFWMANLKRGKGFDCGKAAPKSGQIPLMWRLRNKIYMAAYGGGELMMFDPQEHAHYPENPRVVANPALSVRPLSQAGDQRCLYYSCGTPYGTLGSTLTQYDTEKGKAIYRINPLPDLRIHSMQLDLKSGLLICGTEIYSDQNACPPKASAAQIARFHSADLSLKDWIQFPEGVGRVTLSGPLGVGRWFCVCSGRRPNWTKPGTMLFILDENKFVDPGWQDIEEVKETDFGMGALVYAGRPGWFLRLSGGVVELWNLENFTLSKRIYKDKSIKRMFVDKNSLYLVRSKDILILDGISKLI